MKKLLIAAALFTSSSMAMAGSQYDGFYHCKVTIPAIYQTLDTYVVFLAHDDGLAAMSMASPTEANAVGYSIGKLSGANYTGYDATGRPVSFTLSTGTVTINDYFTHNGHPYPATYSCNKIF